MRFSRLTFFAALLLLEAPLLLAQNTITTVVGGGAPSGTATSADVITPAGVALDTSGNLYLGQGSESQIFKVTTAGTISVFAGTTFTGFGGDGGLATGAVFFQPIRIAFDANQNLYVLDYANNRVRRIAASTGIVTTVAGTSTQCPGGTGQPCGDGGLATSASFFGPEAVAFDTAGDMLIADHYDARIRRVDAITGIITTVAGTGAVCGATGVCGDGGLGTSAQLQSPRGIVVDTSGDLFIADGARIRRVDATTKIITTIATPPDGANFLIFEASGDFLVTGSSTVYRVNPTTFAITTVAGTLGAFGESGDGGAATSAVLAFPFGVAEDTAGNIYIGQAGADHARKVDTSAQHIITTVAGGGSGGDGGPLLNAILGGPNGGTIDNQGNGYIADQLNNRIRRIAKGSNTITTFAGTGEPGSTGNGGPATSATLTLNLLSSGLAADVLDNVYFTDVGQNSVRSVPAGGGTITSYAGGTVCAAPANPCGDGGPATSASLNTPSGLAMDASENLFIGDAGDARVRKVDAATGIITTVAGNGTICTTPTAACGDGGPATSASLNPPAGEQLVVAVDGAGNLFLTDGGDYRVRRVDVLSGIITTVAGNGTPCPTPGTACGDGGPATSAQLTLIDAVAVDSFGNLFIADEHRVRRVDAITQTISTVAGNGTGGFSGDGGPPLSAELNYPSALWVNPEEQLFVVDTNNNRIRQVPLTGTAVFTGTITNFGVLPVGAQSAAQVLTLSNSGSNTLLIDSITLSGVGFGSIDTCTNNQLAPMQSCTISLTLTPPAPGPFPGTLEIITNDPVTPVATYSFGGTGATATLGSITLTPQGPSVVMGLPLQFTAMGNFSDSTTQDITKSVVWSTISAFTATINNAGVATGVGIGSTGVKAASGLNSASTTLTVTAPTLEGLSLAPAASYILVGQSQQFTLTEFLSNETEPVVSSGVTWTSSNTAAATINSAGLATAVAIGSTTITATFAGFSEQATLNITPAGFVYTGSLNTARQYHTATLLNDGQVLIVGGEDASFDSLTSAELYNPTSATFTFTGSLNTARQNHTATLLNNGQVLIVGGDDTFSGTAELYNPSTGTFTLTGTLNTPRMYSSATLLPNGQVLIAGGADASGTPLASAELYDPATGNFTYTVGPLNFARESPATTLLTNGKVLVAGGHDASDNLLTSAELYNPATGTFTTTGSLSSGFLLATATLLNGGTVLITGGYFSTADAEIYDPIAGSFTNTAANFGTVYFGNGATLLNNGTVLVAGGLALGATPIYSGAVVYDPASETTTETGDLNTGRTGSTATLLNNGNVLVAGGDNDLSGTTTGLLASAELYKPSSLTPANLGSITLSPASPTLHTGSTELFTATGVFPGVTQPLQSVTWSSSNQAVATISNGTTNGGAAFGLTAGTTTITACAGNICGSTTLTVTAVTSLASIAVTPANPSVPMTSTEQFIATGTYGNGSTADITASVTWSSGTAAVATINASGLATTLTTGTSTIKATLGAISGSTTLTVTPLALLTIVLTPAPANTFVTDTLQFTATGTFNNESTQDLTSSVTWSSSNTAAATIDSSGLATGVATGTTTIEAVSGGINASTTLTVSPKTLIEILLSPTMSYITVGQTQQFTATGVYSDGTEATLSTGVTWSSTTPATATINASGLATGVALGSTTISATFGAVTASTAATLTVTPAGFVYTLGSLNTARYSHTATLLDTGKVLVTGGDDGSGEALTSAELYDPSTGLFTFTGSMSVARQSHTATLLNNGKVLIVGGDDTFSGVAELYDPASGTFTPTIGHLNTPRIYHSATALQNGEVLIAGGIGNFGGSILTSAELYNPATGLFTPTGNLKTAREDQSATLLDSGKVLITGGFLEQPVASAELYDPSSGTFTYASDLNSADYYANGTLLNSGMVLVSGGELANGEAELYNPATGIFTNTASLGTVFSYAYYGNGTTLLNNATVLLVGGGLETNDAMSLFAGAVIYDPVSQTAFNTGDLNTGRFYTTSTLLDNGKVLVVGGNDGSGNALASAELYTPSSLTPSNLLSIAVTPTGSSITAGTSQNFIATGTLVSGATQVLQSITWSTASAAVATITSGGAAFGVAAGSTTITACAGTVCGSTALTVTAAAGTQTLTVNLAGNGGGKVTDNAGLINCTAGPCTAAYPTGQVVVLTATPNTGSTFTGWSGACTGTAPCSVTMSAAKSVTATFVTNGTASCGPNDTVWVGGASGTWNTAANWSTNVVPNGGTNVCINNNKAPASAVTLNINASIGNLTINPGNSLTIADNQSLTVSGTIANSGAITLSAAADNVFLTLSGTVALTGGGTLTMSRTVGGQPVLNNINAGALINVNNTIQGAGQIGNNGLVFSNLAGGIVDATNASFPLLINSAATTNLGLFEASGSGTLQFTTSVVNKGANIMAVGATATVQFYNGADIQGGTLTNTSGGTLGTVAGNASTLDGITQGTLTLAGIFTGADNSTTVLVGTINNTGTLQLNAAADNVVLTFNAAVTLTGGGAVLLSRTAGGIPILNNTNAGKLTNVNNTIRGAGQVGNNGLVLINQAGGTINANNASFPLLINSAGTTNLGLFEASGSGILQFNTSVVNKGGSIVAAGAAATVQFYNGTDIQGGTLTNTAGGTFGTVAGNASTLDGSAQGTLTIAGIFTGADDSTTLLVGTINNTGALQLTAMADDVVLTCNAAVTLTGGGTVLLSRTAGGIPVLNNTNGGSLNNVNNLIEGAGQIGNNGLVLTNQATGIINANNASFPLLINSAGTTNLGLFEATGSGTLQFVVGVVNKGANIMAVGATATVQFYNGADIQGGTLTNTSGGTLGTVAGNASTLDGITQGTLTLAGIFTGADNSTTVLVGTINNTGTLQLNAAADNVVLTFNAAVTLTGGGAVLLSRTAGGIPILNNTNAGKLTNVNNTIRGAGQVGNNGLVLINQAGGTINANNASFPLLINSAGTTNLGLFEASGSGILQFNTSVMNKGGSIVAAGAAATVQFYNGTDIQGGTLTNTGGGTLGTVGGNASTLDGNAQGTLTIAGTFTGADNSTTVLVGTINNTGTLKLTAAADNVVLTMDGAVTLTGGGTVLMNRTAGGVPILNNENAGILNNLNNTIAGAGQIGNNGLVLNNQAAGVILANSAFPLVLNSSPVNNAGLIVANGSSTPGLLAVNSYTQTSTGGSEVAVGGLTAGTQYSQFQNSGVATLAGTLDILLLGGFMPAAGNQFTILTSSSITGQFTNIVSPNLPNGLVWSVAYNPTSVVLSVVAGTAPTLQSIAVTPANATIVAGSQQQFTATGSYSNNTTQNLTNIVAWSSGTAATASIDTTGLAAALAAGTTTIKATSGTVSGATALAVSPAGVAEPAIGFNPESLTFATQLITTTSPAQTITVSNGGTAPLTINGIALTGTNPAEFVLNNVNCPVGAGTALGVDLSCSVQVAFAPLAVGTRTANVTFTDNTGGVAGAQQNISLIGTASAPAPITTSVNLTFPVGSNVSQVATLNCPSGTTPCTDPQAHSFKLAVSQVMTPFTLTVTAFEVSLSQANGVCPAGQTETTNFNCRFEDYFPLQTEANGDIIVPQCYPYSNGNCVYYRVSNTPPQSSYAGPVFENISWNNNAYVPSSFYDATNPRLYDDPDAPPYDVNHQFVFDITDYFESSGNKVGIDPTIHGHTVQYNDFVVAFTSALPNPPYTLTFQPPLGSGSPSFVQGVTIPVAFTLFQVTNPITNAVTPPNAVSIGLENAAGMRFAALAPNGTAAAFTYNPTSGTYVLTLATQNLPPGVYTLIANSNLFVQQSTSFTITAAPLQITSASPLAGGTVGVAYSLTFAATGGTPPLTWSVTAGTLPAGLTLSSAGVLSGTPSASGTSSFTVQAKDSVGVTAAAQFSLTVAPPALVSIAVTPANPSIAAGATQQFTAAGTYSDGSTQNLTGSVGWSSNTPSTATISTTGLATAVEAGTTQIAAISGTVAGTTTLTVTPVGNAEPSIFFKAASLTFANQLIGTTSPAQNFTVGNTGTAPLTITSIGLTGANPAEFAQTNNCPVGVGTALGVGNTCNVQVTFGPLAVGTRMANVTFTDNNSGVAGSQQNVPLTGTASAPAPVTYTAPLTYAPGVNVSQTATLNCPSGTVPCTDPNAHSLKLMISQVNQPFTLTVTAYEVSLSQANGVCPAGQNETTNFNCRFKDYFTLQTEPNGDVIVPQCVPLSNGNCVYYRISNVPPASAYQGPVFETFSYNNNAFVPSSFYNANNPRLFDDPDYPPYDVNHQFVFDITDYFESQNKVGVDPTIHGHTVQYNDFVIAFAGALPSPAYTLTFQPPLGTGSPSFAEGTPISVAFTLFQVTNPITNAVTPPNAVSVGLKNAAGVQFPALAPNGSAAAFVYNASVQQYTLTLNTLALPPGTYTLFVNSNLFVQQSTTFTITSAPLQILTTSPLQAATASVPYSIFFTATGGAAPYTWSAISPALPPGLTLSSSGRLSGTPTTPGSYGLAVQVADSAENTSAQQYTLTVATAPPSLLSIAVTPANPTIGVNGTQQFTATGTYSDKSTQNITNSVGWSSTNTPVATISGNGLASAAAVGSSTITATMGSVNGSTTLTVGTTQVTEPLIGFNPGSLTFANQLITSTSAPQTITVSNTGSAPLTINSIALTGTNPAEFALNNINCPVAAGTALGVDLSCAVQVAFAPLAVGTRTANVTFTDNTGGVAGSQQNISLTGTASAPAPITTSVNLTFPVGTNVSQVATLNCPSGTTPCTDPQAHSFKLAVSQVMTPFTLTVTAYEVSLSQANGVCPAGQNETTNFNCRFEDYFPLQTEANGNIIVPQCYPYSNGNCVYYRVSNTPPQSSYAGPVFENISWNNNAYVPSSFYDATNPRLYDDPDAPPYDVNHQFVFDITDYFESSGNKVGIDPTIHGHTVQYNDFVVAFTSALPNPPYTLTFQPPLGSGSPSFVQGVTIPVDFTLTQGSTPITNAVTAPNAVSIGLANAAGTRFPALAPNGTAATFTHNATTQQYVLTLATAGLAPDTYTLFVNSNLFVQQSTTFTVTPATLVSIAVTPANPSIEAGTTQQFTAMGTYNNGLTQALTGVTWSSSQSMEASISSTGLASALSIGAPVITATSGSISGSTTLTVTTNTPQFSVKVLDTGTASGSFYLDLQFTNTGVGVAENLTLTNLTFRTLTGTGTVTYNTQLSPTIPDVLGGAVSAGTSVTVRLYLTVPITVTHFSINETGTFGTMSGKSLTFASGQAVANNN